MEMQYRIMVRFILEALILETDSENVTFCSYACIIQ